MSRYYISESVNPDLGSCGRVKGRIVNAVSLKHAKTKSGYIKRWPFTTISIQVDCVELAYKIKDGEWQDGRGRL